MEASLDPARLRRLAELGKLDLVADAVRDLTRQHPGFAEALEWALYPVFDFVVSVAPTPGQAWDSMLDPKCPGLDGLYIVGDSVKNYGGFMDGVAYTARLSASAVTGHDYLTEVLPSYQREI